MWIPSPSVSPSLCLCPSAPVSSTKAFDGFSRNTAVLYKKLSSSPARPYFPPAPSELPAVQQHNITQCLRAPHTCTISATTIVLMLNSDIILKCYPRAAVTITVRQGPMKQGSSLRYGALLQRPEQPQAAGSQCGRCVKIAAHLHRGLFGGDNSSYKLTL